MVAAMRRSAAVAARLIDASLAWAGPAARPRYFVSLSSVIDPRMAAKVLLRLLVL